MNPIVKRYCEICQRKTDHKWMHFANQCGLRCLEHYRVKDEKTGKLRVVKNPETVGAGNENDK